MNREVEIRLYGAFRSLYGECLRVSVAPGVTAATLRATLADRFADADGRALLAVSAFGTDEVVLDEADALPVDGRLCLLPPVCGG